MSADEPKRHLSVHDVIGALGDLPEGEDCVSVVRKQRDAADRPSVTDDARAEAERRYDLPLEITQGRYLPEGHARTDRVAAFVAGAEWAAGRAETTTEDYPDAEGLAALRENAETTTATTEDVARLLQRYAARESVVIFDGAAQEIAQALADAGLLATARTRATETEWGVRWRPDDYEAAPDEDTARLWAASDTGHPVALVRREVTAWTEAE